MPKGMINPDGSVAIFPSFLITVCYTFSAFLGLAFAVLIGDEKVTSVLPQTWFVHDTSAGFRSMDIVEFGIEFCCRTLFYAGAGLSVGVIVQFYIERLFFKKRKPRREAAAPAAASTSRDEGDFTHPDAD